ncbi:hypothetical protein Dvina_50955 [Dactylosporangium vinaceum]|uniref:Uncharacterized protein n=1 Tax=Dactylosporangium vinaceum TaxID=53362 RepID=A0ABV5M4G3_9ACTN|nr:hypothetical protein [Dactylosporangium vinaceum]UAB96177.1 hypothetical protein Dvina_50955 [Dactylosporangium vinaceum]
MPAEAGKPEQPPASTGHLHRAVNSPARTQIHDGPPPDRTAPTGKT